MRKETKEIVWYACNEKPNAEFADVLVRITKTSDPTINNRVHYEIWQWFDCDGLPTGFYRDGNIVNSSEYRPVLVRVLDFEWCYLAKAGHDDKFAVSMF